MIPKVSVPMNKRVFAVIGVAVLALALLVGSFGLQAPAMAAPAAAPTPAGVARAVESPTQGTLWNAQSLAADTRSNCINTSNYEKMDLFYTIDQPTTVNTVTLTLQHTNRTPGASGTAYADGVVAVSANAADATGLVQLPVYAAWTCVYADVANTETVAITLDALLK